jgi:molecular chaperone HtpG
MARLKKVVSGQIMKELETLAKKDPAKYETFWKEFGAYLKQGVATSPTEIDSITPLLRFRTNLHPEAWSSLDDYVGRMQPDQMFIYFLVGEDPRSILRSPHLDYFQAQGTEVLLLTEPMDSFMLMGLRKYEDHELKNVAQAEITEKPRETQGQEPIPEADFGKLIERFKQVLGERVADVRASNRLSQSVARLADVDDALNPELQRVYKYLGKEYEVSKKILELNPSHTILKKLLEMDPASELQGLILEQIYDSALLVEGLHPDPSSMAPRVQQIIEAALAQEKGQAP